jgi:hypothetical protein
VTKHTAYQAGEEKSYWTQFAQYVDLRDEQLRGGQPVSNDWAGNAFGLLIAANVFSFMLAYMIWKA